MRYLLLAVLLCSLLVGGCFGGKKEQPQPQKPAMISFVIYRAAADGSEKLLPEHITMEANGKSLPENALQALLWMKPQSNKVEDIVPMGTRLLSLKVENGVAYANFSKEIAQRGQGSYGEMMLTYAIVNTLTEFPEIGRVQFLVEGKKVLTFSGHMDLEEPLQRNNTLL